MRPTATRRALGIALLVPLLTFLTPAPVLLPALAGADAPAASDPRALGDTPALPSEIPPLNGDIYAADPAYDDGLTDDALYEDASGDGGDAVYDQALYSEGYETGFDTGYVEGTPSSVDPVTVPADTDTGTTPPPEDYRAGYERGYEDGLTAARTGDTTPPRTTPPGSTPRPSERPSTPPSTRPSPPPSSQPSTPPPSQPDRPPGVRPDTPLPGAPGCTPATADRTGTPTGDGATRTGMPAITVSGDCILRGGEPWWFTGYNSFVWSGDCGDPEERMTAADVESWFASMRHDGHGAVRLFFFDGWDRDRLRQAVASAKRHNVYLTITLDDAIGGCGETEKDAAWFGDANERAVYRAHMESLLTEFRGETAIAWFEFFNEPDHEGGALRAFYDEMGRVADAIDPDRLFSSGTVAPYWVDGPANFLDIHRSPGVDLASLHEYDEDEVESNHGDDVRANSAGKPVIVGEFGIEAAPSGAGCVSYDERARRIAAKLGAYTGQGYAGAFGWAWQPGRSGCELGNLDDDQPSQRVFREFAAAGSVALAALPPAGEDAAPPVADPGPPAPGAVPPADTPAPATPAPATPAPVTPAPVTPTPVSPVTPAPIAPAPVGPAPAAPAPVTTSPPPQPDPEPAPAPDPEPHPTTPSAAPTSTAAVPSSRPAAPPSPTPSATGPRPTSSGADAPAPSPTPATTAPAPATGSTSSSAGAPDPTEETPAP